MSSDASHDRTVHASPASLYERLSFILLLLILAWAPFPLGSNRPWAWSLLSLLIAAAWFLWSVAACRRPDTLPGLARGLLIPGVLASLALAWGVVQVLPIVPGAWAHPDWRMAGEALGKPLSGVISLSPWRTITEVMKLSSYLMVAWLARVHGARTDRAGILLGGLIIIGACYVIYGFALTSLGQSQFSIFYGLTARSEVRNLAGPFVNHNSYATYAGLIALAAGVKLVGEGWSEIAIVVGARRLALTALHYVFGQGGVWLAAALLGLSAVIATGSRGGNFATFSALAVLLMLSIALAFRQARGGHAIGITLFVGAGLIGLFAISGAFLGARLDDMSASGLTDDTRLMLWNAALRMIHDAPLLGQGLGTYQIAYPSYAGRMMPFIMDKAHNDYVELAAGWGLPAAILWWLALAWLTGLCVRGVLVRRRFRAYPMLAVGASILVGVHSIFDFSLQMPAIAVTFAAILGLGVAQAFPAREQSAL
jgi:O-antigen ligase